MRILLADDHGLVRQGLRLILESEPGFEVVAEADDGAEAVRVAGERELDLVILDITMPRLTGLQALAQLRRVQPALPVVMLSMHDNERFVVEALRAGASAYVLKSSVDRDLISACHAALSGGAFLHAGATRSLIDTLLAGDRPADGHGDQLSARETEVLKLIAEGHTTRQIGELLDISLKTVEGHRTRLSEKTGLKDRTALTRYAIRTGLIEA
ncbi:Transcriptional regulatory protein DegU [Paraconexibacter sp. AEG42_29]|uniref:Transcriptional regulatory protein DegU n=1 Tax=Paraconexibacter sp. AEG42_29 TaxID=2997339 RepID=A0AAU7AR23_9ACTN